MMYALTLIKVSFVGVFWLTTMCIIDFDSIRWCCSRCLFKDLKRCGDCLMSMEVLFLILAPCTLKQNFQISSLVCRPFPYRVLWPYAALLLWKSHQTLLICSSLSSDTWTDHSCKDLNHSQTVFFRQTWEDMYDILCCTYNNTNKTKEYYRKRAIVSKYCVTINN